MTGAGKVAIVTGANRGIGLAIAHGLAREGFRVAVGARDLAAATEAARSVGHDAFPVQLDVTDAGAVRAAVAHVVDTTGRLDVVVNNAGGHYDSGTSAEHVTDDDLLDAFEVNTIGPMRLVHEALPHLRAAGGGRIVNVSSRSGTFSDTWADAPAYGASKAALNMLTLQLGRHLAGSGILVNACCPGWVRTRMGGDSAPRTVEEGADTPVWLACLPDDGPSGLLFADRVVVDW